MYKVIKVGGVEYAQVGKNQFKLSDVKGKSIGQLTRMYPKHREKVINILSENVSPPKKASKEEAK